MVNLTLRPSSYEAAKIAIERRKAKKALKSPSNAGRRKSLSRAGKAALQPAKRKNRRSGIKIDLADKYFSLFVRYRANWRCEFCLTPYPVGAQGLHCSHFWGRARENTRFDPENASAHCFGCHQRLTANPESHREWKLQKIGEAKFAMLRIRAESRCKKDRKLMAIVCKQMYEKEKQRYEQEVVDN